MITLELQRELTLPKDDDFYTAKRSFPVELAATACGNYMDDEGNSFTLAMDPGMQAVFAAMDGTEHSASLRAITEGAMRFYRTGQIAPFNFTEYMDELFLLRNDFGHTFRRTKSNSLGGNPYKLSKRHSEASKHSTELFAYGLSVHFMAHALGIPAERFFFITAAGARADFHARVTAREMVAAGAAVHLLNPAGQVVRLEVKAKTGWGSFRSGEDGNGLALNLAKKSASCPGKIFCGLLIAIAGRGETGRGRTKIIVADPGKPEPLPREAQAEIILDELLTLSLRFGLYDFSRSVINWLDELSASGTIRGEVKDGEDDARPKAGRRQLLAAPLQAQQLFQLDSGVREIDDRAFQGSVASELLAKIGTRSERRITRRELEQSIRLRRLGTLWFRGVDTEMTFIVRRRDIGALLAYGVRQAGGRDLSGRSAFYAEEAVADEQIRERVAKVAIEQLTTFDELP